MLRRRSVAWLLIVASLFAQTACCRLFGGGDDSNTQSTSTRPAPHFKSGFNLFTPEQDIELGRRSAAEISKQVPLLREEQTVNYVKQLGARLAAKAPGHPFTYQFEVVATKDINAFALPGGYIFVFAGTIAAARNEGELAGVIAHEIAHVALRHGTNQASKAYVARKGLDILRGIAGGSPELESAIEAIGGAGANMVFLRFGRTAESQADLEGAHIMAAAGYDPRDMAGFFKTIQARSGQRTPEILSDHPDPGNRAEAINQALPSLKVSSNPTRDTEEFKQTKARLTGKAAPLAPSKDSARVGPSEPDNNKPTGRPEAPAEVFKDFQSSDNSFSLQYPQNWDGLVADAANMIFAPKGAYGQSSQGMVVTHGIFIGAVKPESNNLEEANAAFVRQQVEMNPDFRVVRNPQPINFNGRQGYATIVAGPSTVTGVREVDVIYTTATSDGRLFYLITMAPEDELQVYEATFQKIISSLRVS
jgi:hypothetical protein